MSSAVVRRNLRDARHRIVPGNFTVTSVVEYPQDAGDTDPDELILVDGWQIGRTYRCQDGSWAGYGPAGLELGHPSRDAALDAQVRAYAIDPCGFEHLVAAAVAEEHAEQLRREEDQAAARAERQQRERRERLGDDEPGPTVWAVPAYHVMYAPQEETQRVADWLDAQGIMMVSARHAIRVEQRDSRKAVVFERPRGMAGTETETHVVTLTTAPPAISTAPRPDLHPLCDEHSPAHFALIDYGRQLACAACTPLGNTHGPLHPTVVPWPCPVLTAAIDSRPQDPAVSAREHAR